MLRKRKNVKVKRNTINIFGLPLIVMNKSTFDKEFVENGKVKKEKTTKIDKIADAVYERLNK